MDKVEHSTIETPRNAKCLTDFHCQAFRVVTPLGFKPRTFRTGI